jgi:hypothetical protein
MSYKVKEFSDSDRQAVITIATAMRELLKELDVKFKAVTNLYDVVDERLKKQEERIKHLEVKT